ncbi:MAG TPA: hypothetical protein PKE69_02830 [Pyrinomonadaceae bacterium]|nr:hypothetical protein [Pyrinomonadaceae bacterium]
MKKFISFTLACFLILANAFSLFAQYRGAPVKKDRLIKALRSKQLQTNDIVSVIKSNGVDFALTAQLEKTLIEAGARPEVIRAVANNLRLSSTITKNRNTTRSKPNYDDLLERAMFAYKDKKNPREAVKILQSAVKLNADEPTAYQMLGFVNLYGLNNLAEAEKQMRLAIENGGSAVFRVFHDDSGGFSNRCSGSLYVSPDSVRFESDDNRHTFETSAVNIEKIKLDIETNRTWKKHTVFKIFMKIGKTDAKFSFAPISANESESKMVERFIAPSKQNRG